MCSPAAIPIAMTLASGAMQAKSSLDSGKYNEQVQKNNAKISDAMARDAEAEGEVEAQRINQRVAQAVGYQRTQMAGNGGVVDSGTNDIIQQNTEDAGDSDRRTVRANARRQAFSHQVAAINSRAQGKMDRYTGKTGAISSLLTAGGSVYGQGSKAGFWG